jgi:hypothetical protein
MSRYDRERVDVRSLENGNMFELPGRPETICEVTHTSLVSDDEREFHIVGYNILEGPLHWPVIYLPPGFEVILLQPTTTYVHLSGKAWVDSLTEHHGVKE